MEEKRISAFKWDEGRIVQGFLGGGGWLAGRARGHARPCRMAGLQEGAGGVGGGWQLGDQSWGDTKMKVSVCIEILQ